MGQECFRVNAPMVVAERVDDEVILINLESGHYLHARGCRRRDMDHPRERRDGR